MKKLKNGDGTTATVTSNESNYINVVFSTPFKKFTLYITRPTGCEVFFDVVMTGSIFGLWRYRRRHKVNTNIIHSSVLMGKPCMVLDTFDTLTDAREYVEDILDGEI